MPKKILVIDDDELLLKMHKEKLERGGFLAETAPSGEEGLKKAKSDPETKKIPVIFLTNLSEEESYVRRGFDLGVAAYLVKARFRPAEIIQKLKNSWGLSPKNRKYYGQSSYR